MRALTLTQPWATLVALGEKRIETRSWQTHLRGPLAIHAAKALPGNWRAFSVWPFIDALEPITGVNEYGAPDLAKLPVGAIVAFVEIEDVIRVSGLPFDPVPGYGISNEELAFGDYTPGRWAWLLDDIKPLHEPYPVSGRQGVWKLSVDDFIGASKLIGMPVLPADTLTSKAPPV